MADRHVVAPWLEAELARQFGPVAAPEALWDRIHEGRVCRRVPWFRGALWPVAAALLLAAGAVIWRSGTAGDAVADMQRLAERELQVSTACDFESDDPLEIQTWVKTRTNIDLDLRAGGSTVRLLGARLIELHGAPVAALAYRVGENAAMLLVSGKRSVPGGNAKAFKHDFLRAEFNGSTQLCSWSMREKVYTIACSGRHDPPAACLLCHADVQGMTAFN